MKYIDVFNGDADGMCAMHQLRLACPVDAANVETITGIKRDIALLARVRAEAGDLVTVADISIDANLCALNALLARGVSVRYFDHHGSCAIPTHPGLHAHIDTSPRTCSGIIVDRWLHGTCRIWAVVAAFGDNLAVPAARLARSIGLGTAEVAALQELGDCINYNAYGDTDADPAIHPASLYRILRRYTDPFEFIASEPVLRTLRDTLRNDLALATQVPPYLAHPARRIFLLPDAPWSRRVRGAWGNQLAAGSPACAHAILTPDACGGYVASVRSPRDTMTGADDLCRKFPGGGGRPAAAGINHLPASELAAFTEAFERAFAKQTPAC